MAKNKKKKKKKKQNKILFGILGFFGWLFGTVVVVLAGFFALLYFIHLGPSPRFRDLFVASAKESSVGGILVDIYLTPEQVDEIMANNSTRGFDEITDTSLVRIVAENEDKNAGDPSSVERLENPDCRATSITV